MPRAPPGALLAVLFLVAAVGGAAMYSYFFCVTQLMYIPTSMDKRVLFFWCILAYFSAGLVLWPVGVCLRDSLVNAFGWSATLQVGLYLPLLGTLMSLIFLCFIPPKLETFIAFGALLGVCAPALQGSVRLLLISIETVNIAVHSRERGWRGQRGEEGLICGSRTAI